MKRSWRSVAFVCWLFGCLLGAGLSLLALLGVFGPTHRWEWLLGLAWLSIPLLLYFTGKRKVLTEDQMASINERFLDNTSLYPQEWNDFVECALEDKKLDKFRKQCDELDPLVNRPGPPDEDAIRELRKIAIELRTGGGYVSQKCNP